MKGLDAKFGGAGVSKKDDDDDSNWSDEKRDKAVKKEFNKTPKNSRLRH